MLLIDGHNLIGQLQDLSLDDPYDEAKLAMAIRSYCMRGNLKATLIFDNGLPGGVSKQLSNSSVTVIFAPHGTQADTLLMRRARDMIDPRDPLVMVTSDRRILRLAFAYGIETISAPEFAIMIGFRPVEADPELSPNKPPVPPRNSIVYEKNPNPVISQQEVAYWLPIFEKRLKEVRIARREERAKGSRGKGTYQK
jgi:predicted RNA-binding protein with PIN domain